MSGNALSLECEVCMPMLTTPASPRPTCSRPRPPTHLSATQRARRVALRDHAGTSSSGEGRSGFRGATGWIAGSSNSAHDPAQDARLTQRVHACPAAKLTSCRAPAPSLHSPCAGTARRGRPLQHGRVDQLRDGLLNRRQLHRGLPRCPQARCVWPCCLLPALFEWMRLLHTLLHTCASYYMSYYGRVCV